MVFSVDVGSVQFPLLLVELILLAATLLLIVMTRKEFRARGELIQHVSTATDAITRQEYFATVIDTIQGSDKYVYATVTGTAPSSNESDVVSMILDSVSRAGARGVKIRYLLPCSPDRLPMARRYRKSGAEVRFHPDLLVSDARFMIVDDRTVIIGVPERIGPSQPTKKGHNIVSESVAYLFREKFEKQWNSGDAKSYSQYLLELVSKARQVNPNVSADVIARNLRIERDDIQYVDAIVNDNVPNDAS